MKITALLISVIVLFLAVEPGIVLLESHQATEQGCCGGVPDSGCSPEANDGCTQKVCNPFFECNSCSIVFISNLYHFPKITPAFTWSWRPYTFSPACSHLPEYWQPPRMV